MKSSLYHIQLGVMDARLSVPFYRGLLEYLDFFVMSESDVHLGASNGEMSFWVTEVEKPFEGEGDLRGRGLTNHFAFRVSSREEVDQFYEEYLTGREIETPYGGPQEYPEYGDGYYAVFFEDPDGTKIEVAYINYQNSDY